jgi:hypothetical protein
MLYTIDMSWNITLHSKIKKQLNKLPEKVVLLAQLLTQDLSDYGTCPGKKWSNFSKLSRNTFHCHLVDGRPTYVACWELLDKSKRKIEVYYVGTHENAPY